MSIGNSLLHGTDLYIELWERHDLFKNAYKVIIRLCSVFRNVKAKLFRT